MTDPMTKRPVRPPRFPGVAKTFIQRTAPEAKPVAAATDAPSKAKADKPPKAKKGKLVRNSYAMPEAEYARIGELKKRMAALGDKVRKSELLRAGIAVLAALDDDQLKAALRRVERIKTGRPAK
jgi:hypothetical protein